MQLSLFFLIVFFVIWRFVDKRKEVLKKRGG